LKSYNATNIKRTVLLGLWRLFLWFVIPMSIGIFMYLGYQEQGESVNVVVVQPNIDSNTEKFEIPEDKQIEKFIRLAKPLLHDSIDYVVGPETQLSDGISETNPGPYHSLRMLREFVQDYPNLNLITGAVTYKTLAPSERTPIARKFTNSDYWYEIYNSSFQINSSEELHFYHKSKLVVAAEMMPFMSILSPLLGDVVLDFGGINGSHGTQETRDVFISANGNYKVGTLICWEAEFGEFSSGFTRNGANLFFAITNDGWWGNTDGHRQHMNYARIRAIENRRAVARSANTGISCFINQRGDVLQQIGWAKDGALVDKLYANEEMTFYSLRGDILGRVALFISALLVLYTFVKTKLNKAEVLS
jgi:apolipoprotein N-acyltransferase